jgi:hypothetical protein
LFHISCLSLLLHGHTSELLRYDRVRDDGVDLLWAEPAQLQSHNVVSGGVDGVIENVIGKEEWIRLLLYREECLLWLLLMQAAGASRVKAASAHFTLAARTLSHVASARSTPDSAGHEFATPLSNASTRPTSQLWPLQNPASTPSTHCVTLGSVLPVVAAATSMPFNDRMTSNGRARFQFCIIPTPSKSVLPRL